MLKLLGNLDKLLGPGQDLGFRIFCPSPPADNRWSLSSLRVCLGVPLLCPSSSRRPSVTLSCSAPTPRACIYSSYYMPPASVCMDKFVPVHWDTPFKNPVCVIVTVKLCCEWRACVVGTEMHHSGKSLVIILLSPFCALTVFLLMKSNAQYLCTLIIHQGALMYE